MLQSDWCRQDPGGVTRKLYRFVQTFRRFFLLPRPSHPAPLYDIATEEGLASKTMHAPINVMHLIITQLYGFTGSTPFLRGRLCFGLFVFRLLFHLLPFLCFSEYYFISHTHTQKNLLCAIYAHAQINHMQLLAVRA